jgi:deoxyhypusine synthase
LPEKVKDIRLRPSEEVASLVDQMRSAGGFMGRHLAEVARIYTDMLDDPRCTKFLSFPAAVVATGTRGVIADMIREGMVDVVVTASGTLYHDLARSWGDYYHGSFDMDDVKVKKEGFHRLGNVLVPLEAYGPAIEGRLQPWLEQRYQGGARSMTTEELSAGLGELGDDRSILRCAKEKGVPVFVPGPMDGAVGSQVWLFANRRSDFRIDVIGDEKRLADITFDNCVTDYGITPEELVGDDYVPTQALARRLRDAGVGGFTVPSAALPGTDNLILFGSRVAHPYLALPSTPDECPTGHLTDGARPAHEVMSLVRFKGSPHAALDTWNATGTYEKLDDPLADRW